VIVIINGPLGVGKTEVSWQLLTRFERAVMLDGDYIGAVHPFRIYDEQRIEYLYQTMHHLAAWHSAHGYHDLIVNYVFETPESLAQLRQLLSDLGEEIHVFRLTCTEEQAARRLAGRTPDPQRLETEISRFRELSAIQSAAAMRGDLGFEIDTSELSAEAAAEVIWRNIQEAVTLLPYDPQWSQAYAAERDQVARVLGDLAVEIHHIGSTAVPGLPAKPVIDLLVAVRRLEEASACMAALETLGYRFVDHPQNVDRRFFRKGLPRSHHLHIVALGSPAYHDHLDFRDALRAEPSLRQRYAALKEALAGRYKYERAKYVEGKSAFVAETLAFWRDRLTACR